MSNTLSDLLAAVGVAPALPGARCRGRHDVFDATIQVGPGDPDVARAARDDARAAALRLCATCPALGACPQLAGRPPADE